MTKKISWSKINTQGSVLHCYKHVLSMHVPERKSYKGAYYYLINTLSWKLPSVKFWGKKIEMPLKELHKIQV